MKTVFHLNLARCLGPSEIGAVAEAYRTVLRSVDETSSAALPPFELRRVLARSVIEPALRGERDPARLCEAGLRRLQELSA